MKCQQRLLRKPLNVFEIWVPNNLLWLNDSYGNCSLFSLRNTRNFSLLNPNNCAATTLNIILTWMMGFYLNDKVLVHYSCTGWILRMAEAPRTTTAVEAQRLTMEHSERWIWAWTTNTALVCKPPFPGLGSPLWMLSQASFKLWSWHCWSERCLRLDEPVSIVFCDIQGKVTDWFPCLCKRAAAFPCPSWLSPYE